MINRELVLEELQARYCGEMAGPPSVERLKYPDFIQTYTGFLATNATLSLTVESFEPSESDLVRVARLRPYEKGVAGQRIDPQSQQEALRMVIGTEKHDEIVNRYLAASRMRRGCIRIKDFFRVSSVVMPLKTGRKIPDIIDYAVDDETIQLVAQI